MFVAGALSPPFVLFGQGKVQLDFPRGLFSNCSNLKDIRLENLEIGSLGEYAFENCINFNNGNGYVSDLREYPRAAFFGCSNLTLTINGTESIGRYAFVNCHSLGHFFIPKSVQSIGAEAFAYINIATATLYAEYGEAELADKVALDGAWYQWNMDCFCDVIYGAAS